MQYACGIANATAIECHIDHLVLHVLGLARVGIVEEKSTALARLLTAAVALFALGTCPMSDNIDAITVWTVEHKCHHSSLGKNRSVFSCQRVPDPQLYNTFGWLFMAKLFLDCGEVARLGNDVFPHGMPCAMGRSALHVRETTHRVPDVIDG